MSQILLAMHATHRMKYKATLALMPACIQLIRGHCNLWLVLYIAVHLLNVMAILADQLSLRIVFLDL